MHVARHTSIPSAALTALALLAATLHFGCTSADDASAVDQADASADVKTDRSVDATIDRSVDASIDRSVDAPVDRSVDAPVDHPGDAPVDDGISHWDIGGPDYGQPWDAPYDAPHDVTNKDVTGFDAPHDTAPTDAKPDIANVDCSVATVPTDVPDGWLPYRFPPCDDVVYVPPSRDKLPPPIVWEPCPYDLGESTFTCRSIKQTWTNNQQDYPYAIGQTTLGYVEPDGTVVFALTEVVQKDPELFSTMAMVVEADGDVRQAIWTNSAQTLTPMTNTGLSSIGPGKSVFTISHWSKLHTDRYVSIGGDDTLLRPPILEEHWHGEPKGIAWAGTAGYYVTGTNFWVKGWDGADWGIAAQGTSAYSTPTWVGDNLLFAFESGDYAVLLWNRTQGTVILRGFPPAQDRGAAQPASDGEDLVWVEGQHRGTDGRFTDRWVMTSKFSTDPAKISPRRLCSWPEHTIGSNMKAPVVGCGYAAFFLTDEDNPTTPLNKGSLLIVRLSDGRWWELRPPGNDSWGFPIALTCTEVFAQFSGSAPNSNFGISTVRRVPLDSLGPGNPP